MHRLFSGKVWHRREKEVTHEFIYPASLVLFDLKSPVPLQFPFSVNGADFLLPDTNTLLQRLVQTLTELNQFIPTDFEAYLLTCPRVLGIKAFNPLNVWLVCTSGKIHSLLAEVNNTFGDRHLYPLALENHTGPYVMEHPKEFHVSPFFPIQGKYHWYVSLSNDSLSLQIEYKIDNTTCFSAALEGRLSPASSGRFTLSEGLEITRYWACTLPRIHWQAAYLYFLKKTTLYSRPEPTHAMTIMKRPASYLHKICMTLFSAHFKKLSGGLLILALPDGNKLTYGCAGRLGEVHVQIHNLDFFYQVVFHGDIGLGDSYVQSLFDCEDLSAFYELLLANLHALADGNWVLSSLSRLLAARGHRLRQNSKSQSKENISAHYDLSNDFFHAFLSPDRNYSCALFSGDDCTLEAAQIAKMDAMLQLCGIQRDQHLLEIGSGWGGLAIHAATKIGCRVTSITLSEEQLQHCQRRIRHLRLEHLIEFRLLDYRDIREQYDGLVSVEMLEAVGHEHLETYFYTANQALRPGAQAAIQVICMPDARYDQYCKGSDWIRHRIFPGGHCPSLKSILKSIEPLEHLRLISALEIGQHYGETLRQWRKNLKQCKGDLNEILPHLSPDQIRSLYRTFICYFSYCEAGFNQGYLSTWQLGFQKRG